MSTTRIPTSKVTVATAMAFVVALAFVLTEGDVPTDVIGWVRAVAKAVLGAFAVGGPAWVKTEQRPTT